MAQRQEGSFGEPKFGPVIRSMTGFGAAIAQTPGGRLAVEARSVNHRFSEILVRTPRDLASLEDRIRGVVQSEISRGRVEVVVNRDDASRRPRTVQADVEMAAAYARALRELADAAGIAGEITVTQLAALPDVLRVEEERVDAAGVWAVLEPVVATAIRALVVMRASEGQRLAGDLVARLDTLDHLVGEIAGRASQVVRAYAERLRQRLSELTSALPVDESRIAAELALFAERSDVTEELTRLSSHLAEFRQTLSGGAGAVGRKLDFMLQEMTRETNTIGAKANDLEITRAVIAMKSELESLREQVQNVE